MAAKTLRINKKDNLIVALTDLKIGETYNDITLTTDIPEKHKFAELDFAEGDLMYLYGVLAGKATKPIAKGERITTQNTVHAAENFKSAESAFAWSAPDISQFTGKTFNGYHRSNGAVGTANHWLVIPLVFCENRNLLAIKEAFAKELGYSRFDSYRQQVSEMVSLYKNGIDINEILKKDFANSANEAGSEKLFPHVDGVKFLFHESGCGQSRNDSMSLLTLLASYINHPNTAGATILSLGCQHAQINLLKEELHKLNSQFDKPVYYFQQQDSQSEKHMVSDAIKMTFSGLVEANKCVREPAPLSHLTIGVECGGSDGFSGISANPAIGQVSDLIVALGGSAILSEFPELCGVENEIVHRCIDKKIADKFVKISKDYARLAADRGSSFEANPSPGNIKDGLITDAIKSAGAAKKGGSSPIVDVQDYPGYITKKGLNLLNTPGNDVESTTALAGAGANLILFSTGLGTPTGNPITPVIKVSSGTGLYNKLPDIIDFNAGTIISGDDSLESAGEKLLNLCIQAASGEYTTKAEVLGQDDFIPWKRGISL